MNLGLVESVFHTALEIEGGVSLSAIQESILSFAKPLGYDRFVVFSASAAREDAVEKVYWVEGDWFGTGEPVDALTYIRRCPVNRHIMTSSDPFFWTKTKNQDGELYRIVSTPRGRGIHGLQVPVFGPSGLEGAMSFGGEELNASPQIRLALSWIAPVVFFSMRRLLEAPTVTGNGKLSDREREILAWTAVGWRQADIATTLGLSERTVENHLRRIRRRLGVKTTAQAILVAIRNGEIKAD